MAQASLRYELNRSDILLAAIRLAAHNKPLLILWAAAAAVISWAVFASGNPSEHRLAIRVTGSVIVGFGFTSIVFVTVLAFSIAKHVLFPKKGSLGEHFLELTEEGFIESTEFNRTLTTWSTPMKAKLTGRFAFIYIDGNQVHVIPRNRPPLEGYVDMFMHNLQAELDRVKAE